jgi:hypothetical protein
MRHPAINDDGSGKIATNRLTKARFAKTTESL